MEETKEKKRWRNKKKNLKEQNKEKGEKNKS